MSDAPATPSPNPMSSALTRSAWLVNALTLCVLGIFLFVNAYFRGKSDEDYVVNGVAVGALLGLHGWSFSLCWRALRREDRFWPAFLALAAAGILLNCTLVKVAFYPSINIAPLDAAVRALSLPVLLPCLSIALLLALPVAQVLLKKFARRGLAYGIGGLLFVILNVLLIPVPMFVFECCNDTRMGQDRAVESTGLDWIGYEFVEGTPELIAETAAWCVEGNPRIYGRVLRSGRVREDRLRAEALAAKFATPEHAMQGLQEKKPAAAKAVALALLEGGTRTTKVFNVLMVTLSSEEWIQALENEKINPVFRAELCRYYVSSKWDEKEQLIERLLKSPAAIRSAGTLSLQRLFAFDYDQYAQIWSALIQETVPQNAAMNINLLKEFNKDKAGEMLRLCINDGSVAMKCEALLNANARRGIHVDDGTKRWLTLWALTLAESYAKDPAARHDAVLRAAVRSLSDAVSHPATTDRTEFGLLTQGLHEDEYKTMLLEACAKLRKNLKE